MSYRPPTLGRKEVDLYRLFREVTAYGGCDSVVSKEGTWAKIYRGLDNFSPTETSASFRLKKMYTKYLLAYEKHVFNFLPIPQKKHRYAHTATPPVALGTQTSNAPVRVGSKIVPFFRLRIITNHQRILLPNESNLLQLRQRVIRSIPNTQSIRVPY